MIGVRRLKEAMAKPASTRIFTVANQKGGVGKTTSTVNIAAAMAMGGLRVLVIDLDPQGNASTALGVEHRESAGGYEVLMGELVDGHAVWRRLLDGDEDAGPGATVEGQLEQSAVHGGLQVVVVVTDGGEHL